MAEYKTPKSVKGTSEKLGSSKAAMNLIEEDEYDIPKELKKKALKAGMVKAKFKKKGRVTDEDKSLFEEEELKRVKLPSSKKEHKLN